jgi:AcrR family transcriptional regulator
VQIDQADVEDGQTTLRARELVELSYGYVLEHGLIGLSLRPLAAEIGSSPRVLLFVFGSKEGLIRAILGRARQDEVRRLDAHSAGSSSIAWETWLWLVDREHRRLLVLWLQTYTLSVAEPDGPWGGFAEQTIEDWLMLLGGEGTLSLAVLRGTMLDLLATGDTERTTAAVRSYLNAAEGGIG